MHKFSTGNALPHQLFHLAQSLPNIGKTLMGMLAVGALCAAAPAQASAAAPAHAAAADDEDGPYSDIDAGVPAARTDITPQSLAAAIAAPGNDTNFASLFSSWKKLDSAGAPAAAAPAVFIPSGRPVERLSLTSNFGARSDPFNGRTRMHRGIDIPGPVGTPIYATADGIIGRAQWVNGYGNFVEIEHGNGIETRYGHMSRLASAAGDRVRRGQLIGYMGSTGRSTGSHLHYEVRVDGQAVNPMPFVQGNDYLVALSTKPPVAMGGPTPAEEKSAR